MTRLLLSSLLLAWPGAYAATPPCTTGEVLDAKPALLYGSGEATLYDIVFLSDGFTKAQMGAFDTKVDAIVAAFQNFQPYATHIKKFNLWRIHVSSVESPIEVAGGPQKNTAFQTRRVCKTLKTRGTAGCDFEVATALLGYQPELVVLVANDPYERAGGHSSRRVYVNVSAQAEAVFTHELGHEWVDDEYDYQTNNANCSESPGGAYPGANAPPNLYKKATPPNPAELPWYDAGNPGAAKSYAGGAGYSSGIWRSEENSCHMRTLYTPADPAKVQPFCAWCYKLIDRALQPLPSASVRAPASR